ncbi:MAG: GNAT family N-acetyltransferase [Proteobacteria bacterium]|nr:MAG: GNAT family N-acetyltransferase [Pseudomonadota bacterium]
MAPTEQAVIQHLEPLAIADALVLTVEAGWNQTAEDWAFFIAHGTVFGARDAGGKLIATAAVLPYSAGFAWVSLVIVAKSHRRQGLGTRMLNQCVSLLRERALVGMLDATPAGAKVYAPLGFRTIMGLNRWEGMGGAVVDRGEPVRPLASSDVDRIARFDAIAFGAPRNTLLANWWSRAGTRGFELADEIGYGLIRRSRIASQLGPVVAATESSAIVLLDAAIASMPGAVFVDVPEQWADIGAYLSTRGFAVQRPFQRMALGIDRPYGEPARVFAIAGPEYG